MGEPEMVCSWKVIYRNINMYDIIQEGEKVLLQNVTEFETFCLLMSF